MRHLARLALLLLFAVSVSACSTLGLSSDDETTAEEAYKEVPVNDLYNDAFEKSREDRHKEAAQLFNEVERQHPYSEWASRAQLLAAYNYYQGNYYADAVATLDRFISLHPGHEDIAYAYYLRALCDYEQIVDVGRDQQTTKDALDNLREVADRFPETPYARDALLKIDLTQDHLAGKEMEIGRYYLNHNQHLAALNRFKTVVQNFQTTTQIPEALHRMVECYLSLGLTREAQATAAVLGHNFPGSEWYEDSYVLLKGRNLEPHAHEGSWISGVWESVF